MPFYLKCLITAAIVVAISIAGKHSDRMGAIIGALPMVTILAMIWLFIESKTGEGNAKVANHAYYTFWYVLPTLPMFLVVSKMLSCGMNFWLALAAYVLGTLIIFYLSYLVLKRFGIELV